MGLYIGSVMLLSVVTIGLRLSTLGIQVNSASIIIIQIKMFIIKKTNDIITHTPKNDA